MTYTAMANLQDGQLVTEEHMDAIRGNIEHLASMKVIGTALQGLTQNIELVSEFMVRGTYTGDDTGSAYPSTGGKVISGVGFMPDMVMFIFDVGTGAQFVIATPTNPKCFNAGGGWVSNFGSDGFTVSDGAANAHPNKASTSYEYIAFKFA